MLVDLLKIDFIISELTRIFKRDLNILYIMYQNRITYLSLLVFSLVLFGCTNVFNPAIENIRELNEMKSDPAYAEGVLLNAYARIPGNGWSFTDVATDNAVSNDPNNT